MIDTEKLGLAIDRLENMAAALTLPLPAEMHVDQFRKTLPEIIKELKEGFIEATGENPWE